MYEVFATNANHQTIRIVIATPRAAARKAETLKRRLEKRYPYLTAKGIVEYKPVAAPVAFESLDDELLA